jgi:putative transcriptional regulator
MIRHHPSPDILADWARGSLHAGAMLTVGCHVHICAICRQETALWESVGGAMLDASAPVALSADAKARVFARLGERSETRAAEPRLPAYLQHFALPAPLQRQSIGMRRWVTPNIWFAPIAIAPGSPARTYLVYGKANTTLPAHTHVGREFTTLLYGSFSDDTGSYGAGDFAETDDTITHSPAVTAEDACLCLISADAPMRLKGRPARFIQALAGTLY